MAGQFTASFTNVMLLGCAGSYALGDRTTRLWGSTACLTWAVLSSFTLVRVLDPTAYRRMARKRGWSMCTFHVGNVVLHVLPALATLCWPPRRVGWECVPVAAAVYSAWLAKYASHLDALYVAQPMWLWTSCNCCLYATLPCAFVALDALAALGM